MEDTILDGLLSLCRCRFPDISLSVNGVGGVVVEVVDVAVEAIVEERVLSGIVVVGRRVVGLSDVDIVTAHDGDAPEVALNPVARDGGVLRIIRIVDIDAATAVHRVHLVVVVLDGVVTYDGILRHIECYAIAVVIDIVILDERIDVAFNSHHVGDDESTYHRMLRVALNLATTNGYLLADGEVELRIVGVRCAILDELTVLDRQIDGNICTATDS